MGPHLFEGTFFMKLILVSAAAAALMLASPAAFAKEHHKQDNQSQANRGGDHGDRHGGNNNGPQKPPSPPGANAAPRAQPGGTRDRHPAMQNRAPMQNRSHRGIVPTTASPGAAYNNAVRNQRNDANRHDRDRHRDNNRGPNNNWNRDRNRDNHNWSNRGDHRNSWQGRFNRRNVHARHHYRYRGERWRWPRGYAYQRWTFGMTLPSIFWANNYWIDDYAYYGLGAPPPGTVWVRYGSDAILIDRYTGEILEVVYGQFY
jgi:Ni/Co efflux regulator RcnB